MLDNQLFYSLFYTLVRDLSEIRSSKVVIKLTDSYYTLIC